MNTSKIVWQEAKKYTEILYHKAEGIAKITINRPERRNAFTPVTLDEISDALTDARFDSPVGVVIMTGAEIRRFVQEVTRSVVERLVILTHARATND